jgi:hypothetical protein
MKTSPCLKLAEQMNGPFSWSYSRIIFSSIESVSAMRDDDCDFCDFCDHFPILKVFRDEARIWKIMKKKEEEREWIEVNHAIFRRKSGEDLCPEDGPR